MRNYIRHLLAQMKRNDDIRQMQDLVSDLNNLINQHESISHKSRNVTEILIAELKNDLYHVTKEKH